MQMLIYISNSSFKIFIIYIELIIIASCFRYVYFIGFEDVSIIFKFEIQ